MVEFDSDRIMADYFSAAGIPESEIPGLVAKCRTSDPTQWERLANEWLEEHSCDSTIHQKVSPDHGVRGHEIVVTAASGMIDFKESKARRAVQVAIESHIKRDRGEVFRDVSLQVTVAELRVRSGVARATLDVSGTVNGQPITDSFTRKRPPTVASALLPDLHPHSKQLGDCLTECVVDICLALDKAAGRMRSPLQRRWSAIQKAGWIGGVVVAAITFVRFLFASTMIVFNAVLGVIAGLSIGGATYVAIVLLGLSGMPREFFLDEPAGKRAVARSGVKTVAGTRFLARLIGLVCAAGVVVFLYVLVKGDR